MFAWPRPADSSLTVNVVPLTRLPCPVTDAVSFGANGRPSQPLSLNMCETAAAAPSSPVIVPVIAEGSQLVPLNWKFGLSTSTRTRLSCSGIPRICVGSGSETIVTDASCGSMNSLLRTVTNPRSNGPALAGVTISNPNGAPPYGPVMNTRPPSCT